MKTSCDHLISTALLFVYLATF